MRKYTWWKFKQVFGETWNDFTDTLILLIQKTQIDVNNLKTRAEVLQWYLDFNGCGVCHTKEELDKVRDLIAKEKK